MSCSLKNKVIILLVLFIVAFFSKALSSEDKNWVYENVALMNEPPSKNSGMDIIIICSNTSSLADFWERRLEQTRGSFLHKDALIISVAETWGSGGAGNGLGTLLAYQNAREKAKAQYNIDIVECQRQGAALAIYHTAGQGKRLAPLTISEKGVKSAVKLPGLLQPYLGDELVLATLLEATIKQSMIFGQSRKGRLSVFWSDQVFIPSNSCDYTPKSHIDILVKKIEVASEDDWKLKNLDNYGIIAWDEKNQATLFDKCSYSTFKEILSNNCDISNQGLGISMGSFSLSLPMTLALLEEFEEELYQKEKLIDSDPYFWMPMTLDLKTYLAAMQSRKMPASAIINHYERMHRFKEKFQKENSIDFGFFGAVDIGSKSYWWDYGTLSAYFENNLKMTTFGEEGDLMRLFYHMVPKKNHYFQDQNSTVIGCDILEGNIKNSLLIGVKADSLNCENAIMIQTQGRSMTLFESLAYLVDEKGDFTWETGSVRSDVKSLNFEPFMLVAPLNIDAKTNWFTRLWNNLFSFDEATKLVQEE